MRDDRYKRAPTPYCWRKFIKALYREADRLQPGRLTQLFAEVLGTDLRQQLGTSNLSVLNGDAPMLPGVDLTNGRAPSPLLADLDSRLRSLPTDDSPEQAVLQSTQDLAERWGRELNTHLLAERYPDGRAIMAAYQETLPSACKLAVEGLMSEARSVRADVKVDLEENLLPVKRIAK